MIMTMRPGSMTVAAGTATWASTFATATAVPGRQAGPGGSLGRQPAGSLAELDEVAAHLRVDDVGEARVERARSSRSGKPSRFDHIAL